MGRPAVDENISTNGWFSKAWRAGLDPNATIDAELVNDRIAVVSRRPSCYCNLDAFAKPNNSVECEVCSFRPDAFLLLTSDYSLLWLTKMTKKLAINTSSIETKDIPHAKPPQPVTAPLSALVNGYAAAAQSKATKRSYREDVRHFK